MQNNNYVQFDEPGGNYRVPQMQARNNSTLTRAIINVGLAKDTRQAAIVLILIGVAVIVLAFLFWPSGDEVMRVPQPGEPGYEQWQAQGNG